ncbi:hypothetical protein [Fusobacterium animalis]
MTIEEIYNLAKNEGLNVGELKDAGITGVGKKFSISGNEKIKSNIGNIRTNSKGSHNLDYIVISTDNGNIKVIFGSPKDYNYNPKNIEKARLIFVEQPKSR